MPNTALTLEEFDDLMRMEKHYDGAERFEYPALGGSIAIPLRTHPPKEEFILDISRSYLKFSKNKFQNRARGVIVLIRLDIDGPPHRNPDGEEIPGTHVHIYRPGAGSKWAVPLPENFTNPPDAILTLQQFMDYCKIVGKPIVQRGLYT